MKAPSKPISSPAPDNDTANEALTHFATAIIFLLVGLAALVWNSERLVDGDFADSRVIGGLHFITLGWLSLSIFGALRVFTGVALGSQGFGRPLAPWIRYLWAIGATVFPMGFILQLPFLIMAGTSLIGVALLLFTIHIVPALVQARRSGVTKWYLTIAIISLWGAYLLGLLAAMVRAENAIAVLPEGYFSAHLLFAIFGWVGATVVGVGAHLIPMFALSKTSNEIPVKSALLFWGLIPIFAGIGAFLGEPFLKIGWTLAAIGSVLWIIQVIIYFRERIRKEYDPGLMIAGGATFLLGISWTVILITDATISFVGLVVIGWLTLFTLGIYHRVIPFLVWFVRFARNTGKGPVPKVQDLVDWKIGITTLVLSLTGSLVWGIALFAQNSALAYAGSGLILLGGLFSLGQLKTLMKDHSTKKGSTTDALIKKGTPV